MNEKIIDDVTQAAKDFIANLKPDEEEQEEQEEELPDIDTTPDPVVPPNEFKIIEKYNEFFNTLTRQDFKKGGHRHRIYKGTLMHWDVKYRLVWLAADGKLVRNIWKPKGWTEESITTGNSYNQAVSMANTLKQTSGATTVMEFTLTTVKTHIFYVIISYKTGH